jgi:hypothetical protein
MSSGKPTRPTPTPPPLLIRPSFREATLFPSLSNYHASIKQSKSQKLITFYPLHIPSDSILPLNGHHIPLDSFIPASLAPQIDPLTITSSYFLDDHSRIYIPMARLYLANNPPPPTLPCYSPLDSRHAHTTFSHHRSTLEIVKPATTAFLQKSQLQIP